MAEPVPNAELMHSLGRLVRGLSLLFWSLPVTLIVCVHTARADSLQSWGVVPPLLCTGALVYGLWQLGEFQKQERVWTYALDRARLLGLINFGLSPFLFWWNRYPGNELFTVMVAVMCVSALTFLASLNLVLQRLGAMLPDEALRHETRQFTILNLNLLAAMFTLVVAYTVIHQWNPQDLPFWLQALSQAMDRAGLWFVILLVLLPLAMTMAMLWKTKEVILDSVFGTRR